MTTMNRVRIIGVVLATLAIGYVASVFVHWSDTIIPGLRSTDDRTFIAAFQQLDAAIANPTFMGFGVTGGLIFTALAALLQVGTGRHTVWPWIAAAFLLHLAAFVLSVMINVPLNVIVTSAGDPDRISDLASARAAFQESTWLFWNHVRAVLCTIAFGSMCWALVAFGRVTVGGAGLELDDHDLGKP